MLSVCLCHRMGKAVALIIYWFLNLMIVCVCVCSIFGCCFSTHFWPESVIQILHIVLRETDFFFFFYHQSCTSIQALEDDRFLLCFGACLSFFLLLTPSPPPPPTHTHFFWGVGGVGG